MGVEQELATIVPEREVLLTIGVFDGVHMGHRYLIKELNQRAQERNLMSGIVTFNPHPQSVLRPNDQVPWLSSLENRVSKLRELGVNLITVLSFTPELAQLSPREFVVLLKKYLKMRGLIIGPDFALGRERQGNASLLYSLGQEMGFTVETVPPLTADGEVVSSTLIRQALANGNMGKVAKLMGCHFRLSGKVISAAKRGQRLGFPTANLDIKPGQALPCNGVYVTVACLEGKQLASVTNIGTRPTFGENEKSVETHILNYQGDLYSKELEVRFIAKLRDEKQFASPEELKTQIRKDIERAKVMSPEN